MLLFQCGAIVEAAIGDQEMGSDCIILPHTDSYTYTSAYLLAWSLAHTAVTLGSETNQHQYSAFLR